MFTPLARAVPNQSGGGSVIPETLRTNASQQSSSAAHEQVLFFSRAHHIHSPAQLLLSEVNSHNFNSPRSTPNLNIEPEYRT